MAAPVGSTGPHLGRVASFDATRGLGTVGDERGSLYPFHATAIADGSRFIDVGRRVSYCLAPGHGGRYEARRLVVCPDSSGDDDQVASAPHQRPS